MKRRLRAETAHAALLLFLLSAAAAQAADLPTGGQIVSGSGSISQSGKAMTVTQDSAALSADWQDFSIGQGHSVTFVQPSASAVALNRVLGSDVSVIQGALTANGKIFLVNPNGVLFTPDAQVNTGGLVATTLNVKTADFIAGRYTFEGDSTAAVVNKGRIDAPAGTVALIAAQIVNEGSITADGGHVFAAAGRRVTLDLGGPVGIEVEEGALDTLIEQGGAIRASGGRVFLTAKAAGDLATSVINHTGVTEAQTLATGEKGEIILLGDMQRGTLRAGGRLDATAPSGGDGGFIETSAAIVEQQQGLRVTARSEKGAGGEWLIDPYNYVINALAASNIVDTLDDGTNVTVTTAADDGAYGSSGNAAQIGDITVDAAIAKVGGPASTLTLRAANNIIVNAPITSSGSLLNVTLDADNNNGARDGGGVVILKNSISTNGGDLNFGTGATISIGGVQTLVGGDVYVGGGSAIALDTAGGNVTVNGEMMIANPLGLTITTAGGDVDFKSIVNSGNAYTRLTGVNMSWDQADVLARNGTAGLGTVGDQYLATVTSRLENAVVVYTGELFVSGLENGAWLGGRRRKDVGTDAIWRWIFGDEAAMDGGKGLPFHNQQTQTAIDGAFINWLPGEPNGGTGQGGEDRLQIGDYLGGWNDLDNNNIPLDIAIRETNLADSPLTIDADDGAVYFRGAVGGNKVLASLAVTTTGDINVNGGLIRTSGAQTYSNDVLLGSAATTLETTGANTDFTVAANQVIANVTGANASLTLKSARGIVLNSGSEIRSATGALDTALWANSDDTGGGYIWMKAAGGIGANILTNGGDITLSGGADTATGYAEGVNGVLGNGITMDSATLQSDGGNVVLRGRSSTTATAIASTDSGSSSNTDGIRLHGGNTIDSGTGTIALTGVARGTAGSSNGIETNFAGYSKITSASTSATAISLDGDATAGSSSNGWGTFLWGTNTSGIMLAATGAGGGVSIDGRGRNVANGGGTHLEPNAFVLAASGPIAITGTKGAVSTYEDVVVNGTIGYVASLPAGFGMASPVAASTSNITLTVDSLSANRVFGGGSFTGSAVQSAGVLTIAPRTNGRAMAVQTANPGAGPLWINPTSMFGASGLFKTGFSKLVFGNGTTGNVTLDNYTFDNDTEINSAAAVTLGAVTIANNDLIVNVTGGGAVSDSGTVAVDGLKINAGTSAVTLDSAANAIGRLAANVASISASSGTAMEIGSVGGMDGVTATGAVDIATLTGDLTLAEDVVTTSTANNAIVLNAGKSAAAGTATGGNIVVSGAPAVTTGAGGRATLFSGGTEDSTGLAALAGAGRYRYNSDEAATNYTDALAAGIYAIYREAPTVTVRAADVTKKYDGIPYNGAPSASITGFVNNETSAVLGGALAFGGTSSGAVASGRYTIVPSGLTSGLGYALSFVPGFLTIDASPPEVGAKAAAQVVPAPWPLPDAPVPGVSGTVPQTSSDPLPLAMIGSLEIVPVDSAGMAGEENQGGETPYTQAAADTGAFGFLKVFVVDGGIRMPAGVLRDGEDE